VEWAEEKLMFLRKQREEREQLEETLDEEGRKQVSELNEELNKFMESLVVDQSAKLVALLSAQGNIHVDIASISEDHLESLNKAKIERQQKLDNRRQQIEDSFPL
jgi:hypothetical protein